MTDLEAEVRHGMLRHGFELLPLNRGLDLFQKKTLLVYVRYYKNMAQITTQGMAGEHTFKFNEPEDILLGLMQYKLGTYK